MFMYLYYFVTEPTKIMLIFWQPYVLQYIYYTYFEGITRKGFPSGAIKC